MAGHQLINQLPSFPLYDELLKKQYEYNMNDVDVAEICHTINNIDNHKIKRIIFLIIYRYYHLEMLNKQQLSSCPQKMSLVPYGGNVINNGVRYVLDNIPNPLKRLIYTYIYEITEIVY